MSRNLHKYYYKDYFGELSEEIIDPDDRQNRRVINASLNWMDIKTDKKNAPIIKKRNVRLTEEGLLQVIEKPFETKDVFQLEIVYPGLVTGIGINHEATIEGEFKLGVHFDWAYGMPVVYGSSVKGVLKSYFKEFYTPNENQPSAEDAIEDIFNGGKKSIYQRDIFLDAVIVQADKKGRGRILCADSITPHGDNPLKNPVPITFLKIAPGCKLEFRFKLVTTEIIKEGKTLILSGDEKLKIFKEILTTVGIGAKTNVGYGQLKTGR